MNVLSPITALVSAMLPVGVGPRLRPRPRHRRRRDPLRRRHRDLHAARRTRHHRTPQAWGDHLHRHHRRTDPPLEPPRCPPHARHRGLRPRRLCPRNPPRRPRRTPSEDRRRRTAGAAHPAHRPDAGALPHPGTLGGRLDPRRPRTWVHLLPNRIAHATDTAASPVGRQLKRRSTGYGSGLPTTCGRSAASTTTRSPPSDWSRHPRRWSARSSGSAGLRAGCWRRCARGRARPGGGAARAGLRGSAAGRAAARCGARVERRGEPGDAAVHAVRLRSGAHAVALLLSGSGADPAREAYDVL